MVPLKFLAAIALPLALSAPAVAAAPVKVTMTINGKRISPSPTYLPAGVPVRLTFANASASDHEFKAPELFYWGRARVPGGVVALKSGQRRTVLLTPRRGSYKLRCTKFGHAFLGESVMIIVP